MQSSVGANSAKRFFELLWPEEENLPNAGLALCTADLTKPSKQRFHFRRRIPLNAHDALVKEAISWSSRGQEVYTGVAATPFGALARGVARDVVALPALWSEIDINGPAHHLPTGVPSMEAALEFVASLGLEPSFMVSSGHGLHLYWLLEKPWLVNQSAEWLKADALSRGLGAVLMAKAARLGYRLDPVYDLARILRVPGTINHKNGQAVPVDLVAPDEATLYRVPDIERWIAADTEAAKTVSKAAPAIEVVEAPSFKLVPPAGKSLGESLPWPPKLVPLITRLKAIAKGEGRAKESSRELARRIVAREPLADIGSRDNACNAAAGLIAFSAKYMPTLQIDDLFEVLWPSVEGMPGTLDNPPPSRRDALAKLRGAMTDAAREVAQEREANAEIEAGLVTAIRARRTEARGEPAPDIPGTYFTPEDLQRFADENDCTVKEFQRRWIIVAGGKYYVWTENGYKAWGPHHIGFTIAEELAPANLNLHKHNKKGEVTGLIPVDEMLRRYGTPGHTVEVSLYAQKTTYDPVRQTVIEASCPLAPLKPVYHKDVDGWLRALGGASADKLLDWVATVTDLKNPSSAIYLDGQASAGKSLFALGLARLWGHPPSSFAQVFGSNFNGDLARCPLVFADEGLPESRDKDMSAVLRDAVSQEERTLNRKYQAETTLKGACRVVIAGNNPDLILRTAKSLSGADLEAYTGRFLHIKVGAEAVKYLREHGGRDFTKDWVSGNKIAEHALWLRDHRKVKHGSRFVVDGVQTDMHRSVVSKVSRPVLEWLVQYLLQNASARERDDVLVAGEGLLLVRAFGVHKAWDMLEGVDQPPGMKQVGVMLKNITYPEPIAFTKDGKELRYRVVDVKHVIDLMERVDGDVEALQTRMDKPLPTWISERLRARAVDDAHPWLERWRSGPL